MKAVSVNSKTIKSVDFTTNCPKRQEGNPCRYCYVEASRNTGFNAKKVNDNCIYDSNQILRMTKKTIEKLNNIGGLRLFSFGDYMPEHDQQIEQFLNDALTVGLKVKVITKQTGFIHKFVNHPAISVIHISVDNVGDGVDWSEAKELRKNYKNILIRCAVMYDQDIEALSFADIFTFNHALVKGEGFKRYKRADVKYYAEEHPITAGKTCCNGGNCQGCKLSCGV